ncbi:MAG TPA: flagellar hook capping FlgD N-terminal domain-containing protein [Planctomycetaceae bacterium]|nr:flagellar hook capping FlgD N-terminal domain-containing protein [Planctomycetaceae bacterium]
MAITPTTATGPSVPTVDADKTGFAGLTSETFMRLLITQLQNQDPLEPVGNEELLNQLSMMRNLQANIELGEGLKAITTNQQLSTAATFIGREITGVDTRQQTITGIADRAFLRNGEAFVGIGDHEVSLSQVTSVNLA